MLLCFKESAAKTDGWHISIISTNGSNWVQPRATLSPCYPATRESLQRGDGGSPSSVLTGDAPKSYTGMLFWRKAGLITVLLHSSFKFWAEALPNLKCCNPPGQTGRQVVWHLQQRYCTNVQRYSESSVLNSCSFCSWTSCPTLKEALGCVDTCQSSQGLLE